MLMILVNNTKWAKNIMLIKISHAPANFDVIHTFCNFFQVFEKNNDKSIIPAGTSNIMCVMDESKNCNLIKGDILQVTEYKYFSK